MAKISLGTEEDVVHTMPEIYMSNVELIANSEDTTVKISLGIEVVVHTTLEIYNVHVKCHILWNL